MTSKEFGLEIIGLLRRDPDGWTFGPHYAQYGELEIWTANRPYADLTIAGNKFGTFWQRLKIRKLMDSIRYRQTAEKIKKVSPAPASCTAAHRDR